MQSYCSKLCSRCCFQCAASHANKKHEYPFFIRRPLSKPGYHKSLSALLSSLIPQTKCPGNKKFATPSLTAYSCPQLPQTSFPSCIQVSNSTRCRSCAVCDGVSSPSTASVVSSAFSMRSAGVGAVGGRAGSPSCCDCNVRK